MDFVDVIIVTRNRPFHVKNCLDSLKKNLYKSFSIILFDQSDDIKTKEIVELYFSKMRINYIKSNNRNKSKDLNNGISLSTSNIVAFTDDDCIVDKTWIKEIIECFNKYPHIVGLYGKTLPYKNFFSRGLICTSIHTSECPSHMVSEPYKHSEILGFGNNMAFQKKIFAYVGSFKEWLGPGSIGKAAEDGEIALRILINRKKLYFCSTMIVYHNKWITQREYMMQNASYICGEMACYGYYAMQGYSFARGIIRDNVKLTVKDFLKSFKYSFLLKRESIFLWQWFLFHLVSRIRGGCVAILMFWKEKLQEGKRGIV